MEMLLHPLEGLFSLRYGPFGSPLFGGHRSRNRLAQCLLHMEQVRRVMRPKGSNIRQQSWRLIACRLNHLTVETQQACSMRSFQVS